MGFKLERYFATFEDEIIAGAKTVVDLKEQLKHIQVSSLYPSFNIYENKFKQVDRVFISPTVEETKTPVPSLNESEQMARMT